MESLYAQRLNRLDFISAKTLNDIDPNDHKSTVDFIAEYAE